MPYVWGNRLWIFLVIGLALVLPWWVALVVFALGLAFFARRIGLLALVTGPLADRLARRRRQA
jgi:hypothetical protein